MILFINKTSSSLFLRKILLFLMTILFLLGWILSNLKKKFKSSLVTLKSVVSIIKSLTSKLLKKNNLSIDIKILKFFGLPIILLSK